MFKFLFTLKKLCISCHLNEQIRKAVKREEKKWEEQRDKALKEQRGTLEQQIVEAVKRGKIEVEKERRNTLALQSKVTELQKVSGIQGCLFILCIKILSDTE